MRQPVLLHEILAFLFHFAHHFQVIMHEDNCVHHHSTGHSKYLKQHLLFIVCTCMCARVCVCDLTFPSFVRGAKIDQHPISTARTLWCTKGLMINTILRWICWFDTLRSRNLQAAIQSEQWGILFRGNIYAGCCGSRAEQRLRGS